MDGHTVGEGEALEQGLGRKRPALRVEPDAAQPFAAQVCKVVNDPYVGRLAYVRCYRGTLKAEQTVLHARSGKTHKVSHPQALVGKEFLLLVIPLKLRGGTGSPVRPIALVP